MNNFDAERLAVEDALESVETGAIENINEYIADIGRVANTTEESINKLNNPSLNLKKLLEDSVAIYTYLRDKFEVQTITEARKCIEERKVDPKIIELWIEEGMFGIDMHLSNAVNIGYPEFNTVLEEKRNELLNGKNQINASI